MDKRILVIVLFLFTSHMLKAGNPPASYYTLVQKAESLFAENQFYDAAGKYSQAFGSFGDKGFIHDRYIAARCWAQAGNADSAFKNLFRIGMASFYSRYSYIINDPDFSALHSDSRWTELIDLVDENYKVSAKGHTKVNGKLLKQIYNDYPEYNVKPLKSHHKYQDKIARRLWTRVSDRHETAVGISMLKPV